jgi:hypothetical protein
MTDKQPEVQRLADEVDKVAQTFPDMAEVSAMLRTQHAAIERKDALLRQAHEAIETDDWMKKQAAWVAITKELQ